ncbi:MFS transporter [Streptosporangium saharense]|uniref:EmrB/QacA subfamily drug resistance transporter n=1 Tax=Streptosporangium saharense TaxID=1706840 RepID=A0A7W7QQR6_9ACTN|nr:MFS transporter [Streptosporangium saharense]MBB4918052.1 EmrB/QacA subfamily drug resistance transporter [Streptosporangium saharense]
MSTTFSPRAWAVFLLVVAADVLDLLSTTVTNVAAPTIVEDLGASSSLVPWLGASYTLAMGSLMIVGGRLGDRYGCRRLFLIGLAGFTLFSLATAVATTSFALVACRTGQGVFGGLLIPQGFVLLMRVIPRESMGRVFGLFGPLLAVSSISGPVVAGLLIEANPFGLSWRSVFLVNVLFGALMLAAALKVIPPFGGDASVRIRPGAALTLMAGLGLFLAGLVDGGASTWTNRAVIATAVGVAVLAAFGWQQARTGQPLLERSLFANRGFVAGLVFGALFFGTVTGVMYVTTLYLQQRLGLNPFHAALVTAPVSVGIIATSLTVRGRVVTHGRSVVSIGVLLFALGTVGMTVVIGADYHPVPLITVPLLVAGLGMGCCFGAVFTVALGDVNPAQAGSTSGVLNAVQQIVNAAGSAIVSTVYLSTATPDVLSSGVLPCLILTLVITVACATSIPLLPRRGADLH